MILGLLKTTITSLLARIVTQSMMEWLLLWGAEMLVEATKTPYDDELLTKIKGLLDGDET